MEKIFRSLANKASAAAGQAQTFIVAFSIILLWIITGPIFNFSNTS